jgi:hypothetical protein
MGTKGYGQHIHNQILEWPVKRPITTKEVTLSLAAVFDIDMKTAQKITNVNMKRMVDRGVLARIHNGIYGKVRDTQFGKLNPRPDDIMTGFLLREGEGVIGYITGPTLLNALGLCTQIPANRHIATNRYRYRLPKDTHIRVYKPILTVDDENVIYLQALEAFIAMECFPVDTDNPDYVLRAMLEYRQIDNEKLIWYARCHCEQRTLYKAIDIALGGKGH